MNFNNTDNDLGSLYFISSIFSFNSWGIGYGNINS